MPEQHYHYYQNCPVCQDDIRRILTEAGWVQCGDFWQRPGTPNGESHLYRAEIAIQIEILKQRSEGE
jgi:hypothetical protein